MQHSIRRSSVAKMCFFPFDSIMLFLKATLDGPDAFVIAILGILLSGKRETPINTHSQPYCVISKLICPVHSSIRHNTVLVRIQLAQTLRSWCSRQSLCKKKCRDPTVKL